jgi:hypothetical protein
MEKTIYLVKGTKSESHEQFKNRIFEALKICTKSENPEAAKVVLTVSAPPAISIIPFKKEKIASISIYHKNKILSETIMNTEGF